MLDAAIRALMDGMGESGFEGACTCAIHNGDYELAPGRLRPQMPLVRHGRALLMIGRRPKACSAEESKPADVVRQWVDSIKMGSCDQDSEMSLISSRFRDQSLLNPTCFCFG